MSQLKSEAGEGEVVGDAVNTRTKTDLRSRIHNAEEQAKLTTPQKAELEELIAAHLVNIQAPGAMENPKVGQPDHAKAPKPKARFVPDAKYKSLGERIAQRKGSTSTDSAGTEPS